LRAGIDFEIRGYIIEMSQKSSSQLPADAIIACLFITVLGLTYIAILAYLYHEKKNRRSVINVRCGSFSSFADPAESREATPNKAEISSYNLESGGDVGHHNSALLVDRYFIPDPIARPDGPEERSSELDADESADVELYLRLESTTEGSLDWEDTTVKKAPQAAGHGGKLAISKLDVSSQFQLFPNISITTKLKEQAEKRATIKFKATVNLSTAEAAHDAILSSIAAHNIQGSPAEEKIYHFDFRDCSIQPSGAKILVRSLSNLKAFTIGQLDLSGNDIGPSGADAIGFMIHIK